MKYHFEVHKGETKGYWAECVELEGCVTQGDTLEELKSMAEDALNLYLDESLASTTSPYPLPDSALNTNSALMQVEVRPDIAFITLLRDYRSKKNLTQNEMKEALGMNNRNSYVKLEKQGNPTFKTAGRIKQAFPDFPIQECFG
jgi:predicted RNase H-like HicB family nuclease/DNA-binding XRE family transcriptional regulator